RSAAMSTAARIARFSIVSFAAPGPAADHTRRDGGDGNASPVGARARCRAGRRAPRARASRTRNTSARSGTRAGAGETGAAGTAPENRRCWSTARVEERARSDGQPFPPLRAPALQHLPPALRLHSLAEAVRLLPAAYIRLKRALHAPILLALVEPRQCRQRVGASQHAKTLATSFARVLESAIHRSSDRARGVL